MNVKIKVGDRFVCADDSASFNRLRKGDTYTAEANFDGSPTVFAGRASHSIERFRPVTEDTGWPGRAKAVLRAYFGEYPYGALPADRECAWGSMIIQAAVFGTTDGPNAFLALEAHP